MFILIAKNKHNQQNPGGTDQCENMFDIINVKKYLSNADTTIH